MKKNKCFLKYENVMKNIQKQTYKNIYNNLFLVTHDFYNLKLQKQYIYGI